MTPIGEWMSATNVMLKNVLEDTIEVRLWTDAGVDNCNKSEDQTHSLGSNDNNEEVSIVNQHEEEEEEETIEVNEDNITNNMFSNHQTLSIMHHMIVGEMC